MNNRLLVSTFIFLSSFVVAQEIAWQQTLGGAREEHLYDAISTYDYGVLLAGSSVSEASGNKKDGSQGDLDYWLWKMTEDGKLEWQKNYGGARNDYLYSVAYTKDGGYILGGSSDSPKSDDKETDGYGKRDYWIVKLNPRGEMEWQHTYGGSKDDQLTAIAQTEDGGFWVAGTDSGTDYTSSNSVTSPYQTISKITTTPINGNKMGTLTITLKTPLSVNAHTLNQVKAYPNPVLNGKINLIHLEGIALSKLVIYNAAGSIVKSLSKITHDSTLTVDIPDVATGIYFIRLTDTKNEDIVRKFVVR